MQQGPLTAEELEWLDNILAQYGTDDAVLDASELDGLLTALLSSPEPVSDERLQAIIWGGENNLPLWNETDQQRFTELVTQHQNDIAERLKEYPEQFEPLFGTSSEEDLEVTIVEEWCIGYMKGVALSDWSALPDHLKPALHAIALHGKEEHFSELEKMTAEEFEQSVEAISHAALELAGNWPLH
ncbi:uncharacterized protein J3D56_004008 [Erwinia persicina]|jgi:uncharacterized protein|uniref:UPF0149 family protein n=2 Tax=Erwinia TaxID=551 RepID=A0ABV4E8D4_9GAMM|nr:MULTISPECIES: UPF0149 family protein [Erwinia]MCP1440572.1 uncharacterized protein [Erwinia persicina]MDN4626090.1 UPF0149 family protein [Erwinia sp. PsM31]MDN8542357.1 UPF0149 family protein [Erwinia sp. BC051422]